MPEKVERALMKVASKYKRSAKAKKSFVYATMTNMQKRGEIPPWRKLKG